jgi:hypothetical protein
MQQLALFHVMILESSSSRLRGTIVDFMIKANNWIYKPTKHIESNSKNRLEYDSRHFSPASLSYCC